ncbi:MAG TPA: TonB-dependent receptor [Candidatus Acidoferrales bacterium]|nr:TonB-dependent receptor [Candidatus Acidoferrales bacterium]
MGRVMRSYLVSIFAGAAIFLMGAVPSYAQVSAGLSSISGIVRDPAGAVIAGANVVVENGSIGVHLELQSSDGGLFNAPSLPPAAGYDVTVDKPGFAHYEVKDITLSVGQNLNIVAPLTIATATTQVEVVGAAPLVDDTKTDVSQVIGSQQIVDLPINGRRVDTFALLTPGVTNDGNFGLLTFRGVANGNTFLLDGNDSTEQFYGENNGRTRITSQISQDAVQEFQVVSADFSAEYGRAMGGVVNTVTRSGTNDYHGTGYFFYRNQNFNATDAFAGGINPDDWRLQSGASLGGPIVKSKVFFFLNSDFTRRNSPIVDSLVNTNISPTTHNFVLKDATHPNGCDPTVATPAQCNAINGLLPRFFGNVPRTVDQDLLFGRIDYHFSDRNTFSFSLNYLHFNSPNGLQQTTVASTTGAAVNNNANDLVRVRNGKATWMSILSPSVINNFRYGWNTDLQSDELNPALNGSLGFLDVSAAGVTLGAPNYLPRIEPSETRNEFGDDLSWTRGRHIFKFGVDFATTSDYSFFIQNTHGSYSYSNLTNFALDFSGNTTGAKNWTTFSQTFGNPVTNTRINDYDFYVEDQWRATDRLTANIGLRYEYSQIPQPPACNSAAPVTCSINSPAKNFMPRIGLAYRLNDKTVVRAGYGLFYARMMGATLQDLFTQNGVTTTAISLASSNGSQKTAGPVFPNILTAPPTGLAQSALNIQFAAPNFSAPYSEQALIGIERQLAPSLALTVSGIWSRGIHLYSAIDTNMPPPTNTTTATYALPGGGSDTTSVLLGVGGVTGKRPNANFGGMYEDGNGVVSFYDGLAVQLNKRFSHGLQANVSYTWSHELDDGQGFGQATQNIFLSNANAWLINGDFRADYGNGLEDQPQRFSLSWIWAPTFVRRDGALYKYLVNNWQLSSITTINSSRPYGNPTISTSGTPVAGMFNTFSINGYGLSGRVPFLPVSSVWQPASYRDDVRLSKILPFGERYKLYLNFEAFNISNSWSPTSMNTRAFTEAGSCTAVPSTCALTAVATTGPGAFGTGSGDALNPDGTEARRLQVSARFTF